ncbi:MAG: BON domain-containing protein [Deltaproteobacteria bacterium]|nr:BON domain-containing protein [Deltaproteobacteria bacterium]
MAIITIYQGASGSGEELADAVAQSLGCGCVGRELLIQTSLKYGISEAKLNEIVERGPTWWERFAQNLQPYRIALTASLCEIIDTEGQAGMVYHGHLGHELLPNMNHVLKVLLTAPLESRIEQVCERQNLKPAAARRYLEEIDKARSRRLQAMFGHDWRDSSRFDVVVNLERMSVHATKHLIVEAVRLPEYQASPATHQVFADFSLATRVHAALVMSADFSQSSFDIKASDGTVDVTGALPTWLGEDRVVEKIKQIPGVKNIRTDFVNAPDMIFGE